MNVFFALKGSKLFIIIKKNKPLSYIRAKEYLVGMLKTVNPILNLGLHSLRADVATSAARAGVFKKAW